MRTMAHGMIKSVWQVVSDVLPRPGLTDILRSYFAKLMARVSRMTVIFTCPGYVISS